MGLQDDALREWHQKLDRDKREPKEALDQLEALSRDYLARWSQTMGARRPKPASKAKQTTDIASQIRRLSSDLDGSQMGLNFA